MVAKACARPLSRAAMATTSTPSTRRPGPMMAGGAIRARHTLTNTGPGPYVVNRLEVVFPLPARAGEVLDFTGRWCAERAPQRRRLDMGAWTRENRRGRTASDAAMSIEEDTGNRRHVGENLVLPPELTKERI